jgi:hypothetical protein
MIEEEQIIYLSPRETYDPAIVGICSSTLRIIYSKDKILEILSVEHELDDEGTYEYFEYNILGAYMGNYTPIYLSEYSEDELYELQENETQQSEEECDDDLLAWVDDLIG